MRLGRQVRLGVVFVHERDVIENVALLGDHLAHAGVHDHGHLARVGRVIGLAVGDGGRDQVAAAVLVLQTLAAQRGAARGGAEQEAARALVGGGPDGVAHTLETEHGVVDIERQHGQAVHAVARRRRRPAGDGAGLADALLQDLPIQRLAVRKHRADVLGRVALAHAAVDAHLLEQVGHAEGACLFGHDGDDARAQGGVLEQRAEHAHEGHGGAHLLAIGRQRELRIAGEGRHGQHVAHRFAPGQVAAQGLALAAQVLHLGAVVPRLVERQSGGLRVAQRQVEAVAEFDEVGVVELLLAVRGHLALAGLAHAVALLGVREDHRGLAAVARGGSIGRVDLHQVMPAALQAVDLLVGHALRQRGQFGGLAEEVVAVVAPILGGKGLHLAIHRAFQRAHQRAREVAGEQTVPVAAPDELDHVPARAGKQSLQLVNDAAVAAHRAVQALQVAVDHPDEVVQPLARGEREGAHGFGFVHLAVAEHAPHLACGAIQQVAVREVAHEARVVDAADGADAHGAGGELPKVRHEPGVRVAAEAARALRRGGDLLAVVHEVLLA